MMADDPLHPLAGLLGPLDPHRPSPPDAGEWLARGYLMIVPQGKLQGYAVALPAYRLITGK